MIKRLGALLLAVGAICGCGGDEETTFQISPEDQKVMDEQRAAEQQMLQQGRQRIQTAPTPGAQPQQ